MKISSFLVSSAAIFVAGSALAADLPAKKAAPAAAAAGTTACPAFGAGYFLIPGGDTCIKLSGYVAYEGLYNQTANTYGQDGYFRLITETAQNTEIGTIKTLARVNMSSGNTASPNAAVASITRANVSFAGFTAGLDKSITDISGTSAWITSRPIGVTQTSGLKYAATVSGFTYTLAEENATTDGTTNTYTVSRPDLLMKVSGKAGSVDFSVVGISHAPADSSTGATGQGYAALGTVRATLGSFGAAIYGGSSYGAMAYTSALPSSTGSFDMAAGVMSTGSNFGAELTADFSGTKAALSMTQTSATPASGSTTNTTITDLWLKIPVAKGGLSVQPELLSSSTSSATTYKSYVMIVREF